MPSVISQIAEWGTTLPYWEQAALERIFSGVKITDETLDELLQYLLEDAGLALQEGERPVLQFSKYITEDDDSEKHDRVRLKRIGNLHNINALVSDQILEFSDQLTLIFGDNGSGKSGYARVIASASFTRGDKQVLPDITKHLNEGEALTADLEIMMDGELAVIHHEIGQVCPEMLSFYVFDSTSVRAHLTDSNPMSFSPAGMEYLTKLVEVTDGVRKHLQQRIEKISCENPFPMRFTGGETEVTHLVNELGAETDLGLIRHLGTLTEEEVRRIDDLDRQIAALKSANIPEQIVELEQTIFDLDLLARTLTNIDESLNDEQINVIQRNISSWGEANQLANATGVEQFQNPWFKHTGSQTWYDFISTAFQLAQAESTDNNPYPTDKSVCLLCHQPLGKEAHDLLHHLWNFLISDAQEKLSQAEEILDDSINKLESLDFELLDDQAVSYRHLQAKDPQTLQNAHLFIQASKQRCDLIIQSIRNHQEISGFQPLPETCVRELNQLIGRLTEQRDKLSQREVENEIQRLSLEKLELEHRKLLAEVIDDVLSFVQNAQWIETANSAGVKRSSAHISRKYNSLFDQLVTQEYIRLFQDTLQKLNCPLLVQVDTRARKGETIKQLVLRTDESISPDQAQPEKVLSEGEQRAVALADFLTEVAVDEDSCGIILDDPVTSLDFHWKARIAGHIIEEATRQQVIVFTHDLHFLYILSEFADEKKLDVASHWIEKFDDVPGYVHLNNSPSVEAKYKTTCFVQDLYKQANDPSVPPERRERLLKEGFGALRTCYEALVVFELFNGVVLRFDEQIKIGNLKDVVVNPTITKKIIDKVGDLSRFIEGHLHSDQFVAEKPTPKMLMDEMNEYENIKKQIRESRKITR